MATLSGNDIYLRMNSVNTQARWRKFDMSFKNDEEDTTAGVGVDWKSRAAKLSEIPAKIMLVYDDVAAATDFAALWQADMIFAVEYGPEGNGAGKPRHLQDFKINGITGPTTSHDKTLVTLEFDLVSTGAPTANLYAGDSFSA